MTLLKGLKLKILYILAQEEKEEKEDGVVYDEQPYWKTELSKSREDGALSRDGNFDGSVHRLESGEKKRKQGVRGEGGRRPVVR